MDKRFDVLEQIGEGTYGEVFICHDKRLKRNAAVKRIRSRPGFESIPITALREMNILMEMDHKNIIQLLDICDLDLDGFYLVFELASNDLKKYMESTRSGLSIPIIKQLTRDMLQGLEYCHNRAVLHRDMKPQNILIFTKPELRAKLADFGLARVNSLPNRMLSNQVVTLWYRSPELLLGTTKYGTEIDIWSAGCILAEMLHNDAVFAGSCEIEQLFIIFKMMGTPNNHCWQGVDQLCNFSPEFPKWKFDHENFRKMVHDDGDMLHLLLQLLTYDPTKRISATCALQLRALNPEIEIITLE